MPDRDAAVEQWIDEVVPGHAEYEPDPSKAVAAEIILGRIESRRVAKRPN